MAKATYTVTETAAILGLGESAAYEAIHRGEIPALHVGRRYLVPAAELHRLIGDSEPAERPRPQGTVDQDEAVCQILADQGPLSRAEIANKLDLDRKAVFMSLFRLTRNGFVRRAESTWEVAE